jgi:hypothetical protein
MPNAIFSGPGTTAVLTYIDEASSMPVLGSVQILL